MENKPLSNAKAALIVFFLMVIYTLIISFGGLQSNTKLPWISYIIIIFGIMILVMKYGKDLQNNVTFGNLFAYGFKTVATLIIFYVAFTVVFYLIFPEYKMRLLEIMKDNALKTATPDNQEQVKSGINIMQRFFWVAMIAGIIISFAILGALGALLGAAFSKRNPNNLTGNINQIS